MTEIPHLLPPDSLRESEQMIARLEGQPTPHFYRTAEKQESHAHTHMHIAHMAPRRTASPYPAEDPLVAVLRKAERAICDSIDYSNKPDIGWGTTRGVEILSDAQKAMYALNVQLAPLLMARENLEMAIITMEKAKGDSNWGASTST